MLELNDIIQRLEPTLGARGGEPRPLQGGITNRNFRVALGDGDYVVRLHGEGTELLGIDRESERLANELAAGLGIAPAVAASVEGCLVTEYLPARPAEPGEVAQRAGEIARALHAFHESGARLPTSFEVPRLLEDYARVVSERGGRLPPEYGEAVQVAARIARALPPEQPRPCHNDLLAGNIMLLAGDAGDAGEAGAGARQGATMIVDWEYAGMGHPCFDLGNLSVNNGFGEAEDERLLAAYYGEPPTAGRRAALALMRVLSDAREAAWAVVQEQVSRLQFDFHGYGREHFARLRAAAAHPDFEELLAGAAA